MRRLINYAAVLGLIACASTPSVSDPVTFTPAEGVSIAEFTIANAGSHLGGRPDGDHVDVSPAGDRILVGDVLVKEGFWSDEVVDRIYDLSGAVVSDIPHRSLSASAEDLRFLPSGALIGRLGRHIVRLTLEGDEVATTVIAENAVGQLEIVDPFDVARVGDRDVVVYLERAHVSDDGQSERNVSVHDALTGERLAQASLPIEATKADVIAGSGGAWVTAPLPFDMPVETLPRELIWSRGFTELCASGIVGCSRFETTHLVTLAFALPELGALNAPTPPRERPRDRVLAANGVGEMLVADPEGGLSVVAADGGRTPLLTTDAIYVTAAGGRRLQPTDPASPATKRLGWILASALSDAGQAVFLVEERENPKAKRVVVASYR